MALLYEINQQMKPLVMGKLRCVLLRGLGLPTEIPPGVDTERMRRALLRDKKQLDGVARFALPVRVGEVRVGGIERG